VEVLDLLQQIPGAVGVLNIGGDDAEQEAGGIAPDMAPLSEAAGVGLPPAPQGRSCARSAPPWQRSGA
jgi:hypothetical protein